MGRKYLVVVLALACSMIACSNTSEMSDSQDETASASKTPASTKPSPTPCGTSFLDGLTRRQKLAQLINVGVTGTADAMNIVRTEHVGGIFIGSSTDESLLAGGGVKKVQQQSDIPLMVAIDEEGGRVERLGAMLGKMPSARRSARTMSPKQVHDMALKRGRALKKLGINVDFAPVVDVTGKPANTVIGDRSYSADPDVVARYAAAFAKGLRDADVLPVLKHFPGHGSASGDSHTGVVTTPPLAQLKVKDLDPYKKLVDSGVGVMLGHLIVPGLTEKRTPASISARTVKLLRDGKAYGAPPFDGPIFTDDLIGMKAITDEYSISGAAAKAIEAGVDIAFWITTDDVSTVLDHLEQQVKTGKLSQERVDDAVLTVARSKGIVHC